MSARAERFEKSQPNIFERLERGSQVKDARLNRLIPSLGEAPKLRLISSRVIHADPSEEAQKARGALILVEDLTQPVAPQAIPLEDRIVNTKHTVRDGLLRVGSAAAAVFVMHIADARPTFAGPEANPTPKPTTVVKKPTPVATAVPIATKTPVSVIRRPDNASSSNASSSAVNNPDNVSAAAVISGTLVVNVEAGSKGQDGLTEADKQRTWQGTENERDRNLRRDLTDKGDTQADNQRTFQTGENDADRQLKKDLADKTGTQADNQRNWQGTENERDRNLRRDLDKSAASQADNQRQFLKDMADKQIAADADKETAKREAFKNEQQQARQEAKDANDKADKRADDLRDKAKQDEIDKEDRQDRRAIAKQAADDANRNNILIAAGITLAGLFGLALLLNYRFRDAIIRIRRPRTPATTPATPVTPPVTVPQPGTAPGVNPAVAPVVVPPGSTINITLNPAVAPIAPNIPININVAPAVAPVVARTSFWYRLRHLFRG